MKKLLILIAACLTVSPALSAGTTEIIKTKHLTLFGEYLNWYASQQSDAVWANDIGFPATNHVTYATPNLKFNWHSGFRVGAAFAIPRFWDVTFSWTHTPTSKTMDYSAAPFHIMTPEFFSGYLSGDTFSSAAIHWKIAMDSIDVVLSHAFHATPSLEIKPSMGVKAATINQTLNTRWNNTLFTLPIFTSKEVIKNNFSGIGPEFGLEGTWHFLPSFSLVSQVSTALMWGRWHVSDVYSRPNALFGLIKATRINTNMLHAKLGSPMYQAFFGLQWLHDATYQVKFVLGYEMQYWANQLRVPTFQLLPLHGDLTLQGGTCGLSISL